MIFPTHIMNLLLIHEKFKRFRNPFKVKLFINCFKKMKLNVIQKINKVKYFFSIVILFDAIFSIVISKNGLTCRLNLLHALN